MSMPFPGDSVDTAGGTGADNTCTLPPAGSTAAVTELFDAEFKFIYEVPTALVVHLPPARLNITRLVVCRNYRPHDVNSCGMGDGCKFVHVDCDLSTLECHPIHVNYIWRHEELCTYPRLPAGEVLEVSASADGVADSIPTGRLLRTVGAVSALQASRTRGEGGAGVLLYCAAFFESRLCRDGDQCNFVHVLHVDATVKAEYRRAPARSLCSVGAAAAATTTGATGEAAIVVSKALAVEPGQETAGVESCRRTPPQSQPSTVTVPSTSGAVTPQRSRHSRTSLGSNSTTTTMNAPSSQHRCRPQRQQQQQQHRKLQAFSTRSPLMSPPCDHLALSAANESIGLNSQHMPMLISTAEIAESLPSLPGGHAVVSGVYRPLEFFGSLPDGDSRGSGNRSRSGRGLGTASQRAASSLVGGSHAPNSGCADRPYSASGSHQQPHYQRYHCGVQSVGLPYGSGEVFIVPPAHDMYGGCPPPPSGLASAPASPPPHCHLNLQRGLGPLVSTAAAQPSFPTATRCFTDTVSPRWEGPAVGLAASPVPLPLSAVDCDFTSAQPATQRRDCTKSASPHERGRVHWASTADVVRMPESSSPPPPRPSRRSLRGSPQVLDLSLSSPSIRRLQLVLGSPTEDAAQRQQQREYRHDPYRSLFCASE